MFRYASDTVRFVVKKSDKNKTLLYSRCLADDCRKRIWIWEEYYVSNWAHAQGFIALWQGIFNVWYFSSHFISMHGHLIQVLSKCLLNIGGWKAGGWGRRWEFEMDWEARKECIYHRACHTPESHTRKHTLLTTCNEKLTVAFHTAEKLLHPTLWGVLVGPDPMHARQNWRLVCRIWSSRRLCPERSCQEEIILSELFTKERNDSKSTQDMFHTWTEINQIIGRDFELSKIAFVQEVEVHSKARQTDFFL